MVSNFGLVAAYPFWIIWNSVQPSFGQVVFHPTWNVNNYLSPKCNIQFVKSCSMMSMFNLVTSACLVLVNSVHCKRRGSLYLLSRERLATESFQARSPRYNGTSEDGRREDHGCSRQEHEEGGHGEVWRRKLTWACTSCL